MEKTNKVINVKNLNDENRSFDIKKLLLKSSDCIFTFAGAYFKQDGEFIQVSREDERASFYSYIDMESGKTVNVPVGYSDIFEEVNHVSSFNYDYIKFDNNFYSELKRKEEENKRFVRTISSQR